MLRRVAKVLRRTLFVLGVILVLWMPVSWFLLLEASTRKVFVEVSVLAVRIEYIIGDAPPRALYKPGVRADAVVFGPDGSMFVPNGWRYESETFSAQTFMIPLWLLAFICLAWPVTSFILARRRHKRGFPVEPARNPNEETRNPNETRMTE